MEMASKLTNDVSGQNEVAVGEPIALSNGSVRFLELDAETMGEYFARKSKFDCVWISEAMSHLPDKKLFVRNAFELLNEEGKLVIADWFKAEDLKEKQVEDDIKPIEGEFTRFSYNSCHFVYETPCRWHAPPTPLYAIRLRQSRQRSRVRRFVPSLRYQPTSIEDMVSGLFSKVQHAHSCVPNPIQGHLVVAGTVTLSVGLCVDARKGWNCVPTGISGYEKRVCECDFPVCCHGVSEGFMM